MKFLTKMIACLVIVTIATGAIFSPASAQTETYKVTDHRGGGLRIETLDEDRTRVWNVETGLINISNGTDFSGMTYDTNRYTSFNKDIPYVYSNWAESGVPKHNQLGNVLGVLKDSYPARSISEIQDLSGIANLTKEEAMAATQAGVWYFSNNSITHRLFNGATAWKKAIEIKSDKKSYKRIMDLYEHYKKSSAQPEPKNIQRVITKITQPTEDLFTNQKVFITLTSSDNSDISVKASRDFEFFYKKDNSVVDLNAVKSGEEIYFTSPATKGDLQLTFNRKNMYYPMGTVFKGDPQVDKEGKFIQVILAKDVLSKEDATATISWKDRASTQTPDKKNDKMLLPAASGDLLIKGLLGVTGLTVLIGIARVSAHRLLKN